MRDIPGGGEELPVTEARPGGTTGSASRTRQPDAWLEFARDAPARTLIDVFADTVRRSPRRTALDAPDGALTYQELAVAATDFGNRLRERGVGPGDRVGIHLRSGTAELYTAILGALCAGAAYIPIDTDDSPAPAVELLGQAGACAVVEDGLAISMLSEPLAAARYVGADDDAWVVFTSGSTGAPKAVAVTHRAATAFVEAEHPWRATGLETPVFADPSGRRARAMSGIGLAILAMTLAALVIVATAALGFSSISAPGRPAHALAARAAASTHGGRRSRRLTAHHHGRREHSRYVIAKRAPGAGDRVSPDRNG
jgi:non-ribosomal peptide synthetase component F